MNRRLESLNSWLEWCWEAQYEAWDQCTSCDGVGYHGIEAETGCAYSCYACGETGKYGKCNEN